MCAFLFLLRHPSINVRSPESLGGGAGELERKNKSETSIENDKEGKVYGARERMTLGNVKIRKKKRGKPTEK